MTTTPDPTAESVIEKINRALTADHPGQAYENMMMREALIAARRALLAEAPTEEQVERAALAMIDASPDVTRETVNDEEFVWYLRDARAALTAVRVVPQEPTEQQVREGARAIPLAYEQAVKISRDVLTAAAGVAPQEPSGPCGERRRNRYNQLEGCCLTEGHDRAHAWQRVEALRNGDHEPDASPDRETLIAEARRWPRAQGVEPSRPPVELINDLADALAVPVEVDEAKLDPEKVAAVINRLPWGYMVDGPSDDEIARAICEAYERGELT